MILKRKASLSLMIIFCLILSFFTQDHSLIQKAHANEPDEEETFIINDTDIGDGMNQFQYYGPWNTSSGVTDLYNGDEHWVKVPRSSDPESIYYTIKFEGDSIKLYGIKDPAHGIYAVSINGGEEVEIDASSATRAFDQLLFESDKLAFGEHVIKVRATGKTTGTASDMQIDYAEVTTKYIDVTGIEMDEDPIEVEDGMTVQLNANVLPANATNKNITWSSSDEQVAKIDENGKLKAGKVGTATLVATTEVGGFTATREVNVRKGDHSLKGAVGTTNMHYVKENTFREDYKRIEFDEIKMMTETKWEGNAWKGDRASAQFVLWTTNERKENVFFQISNLVDGKGNNIDSSHIKANFVETTKAARGRPAQGKQELIPDIIDSAHPVDMEKHSVQPIWISIDVPRNATPGDYTGQVTVQTTSGEEVDFTLALEVLDVTLPKVEDREYFLDLWQNPYAVARINNIPKEKLWTKEHFDVMRPHYQMLAEAGQKVITATVTHDPWNSQTYDPYDSMVKWTKKPDGSYEFDFDDFDKWVQFMMDLGIDEQIDAYSMVSWASKIKYYDEVQEKEVIKTVPVNTEEWHTMWGAFLEAFVPHLEEKGWLDKTYMANDERGLDLLLIAADLIDEVSDGRLKMTAAMNYNSLNDDRLDRIHNISIAQLYVDHHSKDLTNVAQQRREKGLNTTMYTMVNTYPSNFIRSNPAEPVWVIWNTIRHDVDGFLRWAYDSFVEDPFETTDYKYWESGDAFQVYPQAKSSIRFEKMKEGIRDAEKVRYITERDRELGKQLEEAMWSMEDVGYAKDPYGGVKEPGLVNIPDEVNKLKNVLYDVTKQYIKESQPEPVDKSHLTDKINEANKRWGETEEGSDPGQYPSAARNELKVAITEAELILKDQSATQEEVNKAVQELETAIQIYNESEIKDAPPRIDTAELKKLIASAKAISNEEGTFTKKSYQALKKAVKKAENVLGKIETEAQLASAIKALQLAMQGLVKVKEPPVVDTTELEKLIALAKAISNDDVTYTKESYNNLLQAIKEAEKDLKKIKNEQQLANTLIALQKAINQLEKQKKAKQIEIMLNGTAKKVEPSAFVIIKGTNATIQLPKDLPEGTKLKVETVNIPFTAYRQAGEVLNFLFTYPTGYEDYKGDFTLSLGLEEKAEGPAIYYFDKQKKAWTYIGGKVKDRHIVANVNDSSTYGVFSEKVEKEVTPNNRSNHRETKAEETLEGSTLPETATPMYNWLVVGLLLLSFGGLATYVSTKRKKVKRE